MQKLDPMTRSDAIEDHAHYVYRPRSIGWDVLVYDVHRLTAIRDPATNQYVYTDAFLVSMSNLDHAKELIGALTAIAGDPYHRIVASVWVEPVKTWNDENVQYFIELHGTGSIVPKRIPCRQFSVTKDAVKMDEQLVQLQYVCKIVNRVSSPSDRYYARRYKSGKDEFLNSTMVLTPTHERFVTFSDKNDGFSSSSDVEFAARTIANLLNDPPPGEYRIIPLWNNRYRGMVVRGNDLSNVRIYPIMAMETCVKVIEIVKAKRMVPEETP